MAGRPKKKPEYNPELQFNNFLQELRDAYEEADSLRSLADELNISLLKLRKLLITADVFTSDICTEINDLHQSGKKIPEIMKRTGLSRASVHSYLPYTKGLYNAAEISLNAERCRTYKIRQEQVRLLQEIPSEGNLWQAVIAFQDYPFKTATGLPFRYKLKVGKNGEYNRELLIDRREKWRSVLYGWICSENTLSDNGGVTRGICKMDAENNLTEVVETKNIVKTAEGAEAGEVKLDVDSLVSMNMWGLTPDFLKTLEEGFKEFFEKEVPANPLKAEYLIPTFIGELLSEGKMSVKVLRTNDTWYGMTYKEDVAAVKESFSKMLENGTYKGDLFSDL